MSHLYIKCFAVAALVCVLSLAVTAASVRVDVPLPEYSDGEASAETVMPVAGERDRVLKITLSFMATPTNSVEVALGAGLGGGPLDPDGMAVVIGWDCGEWFITGDRLRQRFTAAAANPMAAGPRVLAISVRLASGAVAVSEVGAGPSPVAFGGLGAGTLRAWLCLGGRDTLRVASRGGAEASAEAWFSVDGTNIILR